MSFVNAGVELFGSEREIAAVLDMLSGGASSNAGRVPAKPRSSGSDAGAPARRKPVSTDVAKARQLQGRYMGITRSLPPRIKNQVKAVAKAKGVAEALKMAERIVAERKKA